VTTILLTGFGPFPGAPLNPTEVLVRELAPRRYLPGVRCRAHVFATSYQAVDQELPALLAREKPDALIMFGLAARARHIRIETRARNALSRVVPDAAGIVPRADVIAAGAPATLRLRVPASRVVAAVRAAGIPAALSVDAGDYLCNYVSWRAAEAARNGTPRLVAFVHVPFVRAFADLLAAGEAVIRSTLPAARIRR
jgi:pyroglutamyl-peptidase